MRWSFLFAVLCFILVVSSASSNVPEQQDLPQSSSSRTFQTLNAPAAIPSRSLTGHQVMVLLLCLFILLASILGPLLPMALATTTTMFSDDDAHSLAMFKANRGPTNSVLLDLHALSEAPIIFDKQAILAKYPQERVLQRDETGVVWTGIDPETGKRFVLKRIHSKEYAKDIEAEFKAMRRIGKHPHAGLQPAKAVYHGEDSTEIVSDFIDGATWGSMADLTFEENLLIMHDAAQALEHLHTRVGISHDDLHMRNIMIDRTGKVMIIDFSRSQKITNGRHPFDLQNLARNLFMRLIGPNVPVTITIDFRLIPRTTPLWIVKILARIFQEKIQSGAELASELRSNLPRMEKHRKSLAAKASAQADRR